MLKPYKNIHTLLEIPYLQPPHPTVRHESSDSMCCRMRSYISVVCASISCRLAGVLHSHEVASGGEGVGVRSTTSSLDSTHPGSCGTKPASLKLAGIFSFCNRLVKSDAKGL
jgi:hypothetical protein